MKKRKVCFVITSNIHYSRSKEILRALKKRRDILLQIVVGGSAVLERYGEILEAMRSDGFQHDLRLTMTFEGGDSVAMAKTTGIGVSEFATAFDTMKPDVVVVRGDRYEVLSAAIAASYLNIPIAHLEGGDVTGTIDESVRHAVTKLAHIHFPTNEQSRQRIIRMGERPECVFNVGCPEVEFIARNKFSISRGFINRLGVGDLIDIRKPYLMVMNHPVATEPHKNRHNTEVLLSAVFELGVPTVWFWPNVDAGTDDIAKEIRTFRERQKPEHMRFVKYVPAEQFIGLLQNAACLVGNSSAGIKECSFLGVPTVNIGSRQNGRMRAENVIDVDFKKRAIQKAIDAQLAHGRYEQSAIYYQPDTSKKISEILAGVGLYTQKKFVD
ncbi:MAG: UDP-N-acetylglucosamine 2-epimerase (hydrolyzing) [Parcubacteria group bacterium]|nr:UDP-N-acetylglucosamine 2-epimerase (hydrolyzing) [Parcubacteria group bacterium]